MAFKPKIISFFFGLLYLATSFVYTEELIEPGVLIVKLKTITGLSVYSATSELDKLNTRLGITTIKPLQFPSKKLTASSAETPRLFIYQLPENVSATEAAKLYQKQAAVEYAEPCYGIQLDALSTPQTQKQQYLFKTELKYMLLLPENSDILVAVIDSGIDPYCADLQNSLAPNGYNFYGWAKGFLPGSVQDDYGHGTHLAGIIAASPNNMVGVMGFNSRVKILPIRFTDGAGRGSQLDAAAAIRYAVDMRARIINCSWGYYQYNQVLKEAIDYALSKGVTVIASVGNDGFNASEYPAAFPGVISIGSVNEQKKHLDFSNIGNYVDFVTYGENIYSTLPKGLYGEKSGTSQSAAIFTGIVARILAYKTELTPKELQALLVNNSDLIDTLSKDNITGYGILNMSKLFKALDLPEEIITATSPNAPQNTEEHDSWLITVLLFPFKVLEGLFHLF